MYKYFTAVQNKNWVKIINDLVESYNNTHHRSIKTTPNTVNKENEKEIFLNLYGFRANDSKSFPKQIYMYIILYTMYLIDISITLDSSSILYTVY